MLDAIAAVEFSIASLQAESVASHAMIAEHAEASQDAEFRYTKALNDADADHEMGEGYETEAWMARLEAAALQAEADYAAARRKLQIVEAIEGLTHDALIAAAARREVAQRAAAQSNNSVFGNVGDITGRLGGLIDSKPQQQRLLLGPDEER